MPILTATHVYRQISGPCRRQASEQQRRYLSGLIADAANAGLIRWDRDHLGSLTVYDASKKIERLKNQIESTIRGKS